MPGAGGGGGRRWGSAIAGMQQIVIRRLAQSARNRPSFALCLGTVRCIFSDICGTDAGAGSTPGSAGLGDYTAAGALRHPARFLLPSFNSVVEMLRSSSRARASETIGSRTGKYVRRGRFFSLRFAIITVVYGARVLL